MITDVLFNRLMLKRKIYLEYLSKEKNLLTLFLIRKSKN